MCIPYLLVRDTSDRVHTFSLIHINNNVGEYDYEVLYRYEKELSDDEQGMFFIIPKLIIVIID